MPNISWKNTPGAGTLAVGGTPTGVDISENWYYPTTAGDKSLEVINGHLDSANLDSALRFNNNHFQRGTISQSKMVGCTANIDYFGSMFAAQTNYEVTGTYKEKSDSVLSLDAVAVPGLCVSFYVPWGSTSPAATNAKCILQWSFNHQNDGLYNFEEVIVGSGKSFPSFFLHIDGEMDPVNARRYIPGAYRLKHTTAAAGVGPDYRHGRSWSGHKLVTLTKGWHKAEIRMTIPKYTGGDAINQCRVRTRGMRYILFR